MLPTQAVVAMASAQGAGCDQTSQVAVQLNPSFGHSSLPASRKANHKERQSETANVYTEAKHPTLSHDSSQSGVFCCLAEAQEWRLPRT